MGFLIQLGTVICWRGRVEPQKGPGSCDSLTKPLNLDNPVHLDALRRAYDRFTARVRAKL
jgi:hypothetical protein